MTETPWFLLPPDAPQPSTSVSAAVPPVDRHEVARFTREQPPPTIPARQVDRPVAGLVAHELLGGRVIRRFL